MKDLPLHLVHRFEFSTVTRGSESEKVCYSWVLGTLDGFVVFVVFLGPPIKLRRFLKLCEAFVTICWDPPIQLWRLPQALCGFGDHLKVP